MFSLYRYIAWIPLAICLMVNSSYGSDFGSGKLQLSFYCMADMVLSVLLGIMGFVLILKNDKGKELSTKLQHSTFLASSVFFLGFFMIAQK